MKHIHNLFLFLALGFILSSCDKDKDDFVGTDHAITSFTLEKDGITYIGSIKEDRVTISLPENKSLNNAKATIVISENATMTPDPSTITNWNEEFRFSIKSYNGETAIFIYTPIFTPIRSEPGDIHLATQQDVDAFVAQENLPSIIDGSLIIGKATGDDETDLIDNISGLSGIKEIRNNLVFNQTFAIEDLYNFVNLEKIGGLEIKSTQRIKTVEFNKLSSILGNVTIVSPSLQSISFPELTKVNGAFSLTTNTISEIELPVLEIVKGNFSLYSNNTLNKFSLPNLSTIQGQFVLNNCLSIKVCDLPKLKECGNGIDFNFLNSLAELEFPALTSTGGYLKIYNSGMSILSFPTLTHVEHIDLAGLGSLSKLYLDELELIDGDFKFQSWRSPFLTKLTLPKLKKVTNNIDIITTHGANYYTVEEISMPKLEEVGTSIKLYVGYALAPNTSLQKLDFSSLTKVATIDISNQSLLSDFSSLKNLVPNITEEQWKVVGCDYNPTYEDMVNGSYSEK